MNKNVTMSSIGDIVLTKGEFWPYWPSIIYDIDLSDGVTRYSVLFLNESKFSIETTSPNNIVPINSNRKTLIEEQELQKDGKYYVDCESWKKDIEYAKLLFNIDNSIRVNGLMRIAVRECNAKEDIYCICKVKINKSQMEKSNMIKCCYCLDYFHKECMKMIEITDKGHLICQKCKPL